MSVCNQPASQLSAVQILTEGYFQVSRKFRTVAKFPPGKNGMQALFDAAAASGDHGSRAECLRWVDSLGETAAGDYYLRVYAETLTVPVEVFDEFRRLGGGTYR